MNEDKMELEEAKKYLKLMKMDKNNLNKIGYVYGTEAIKTVLEALENSIPRKKIEDVLKKIQEEYELLLEHQSGKESNRTIRLHGKIDLAQELLEEK